MSALTTIDELPVFDNGMIRASAKQLAKAKAAAMLYVPADETLPVILYARLSVNEDGTKESVAIQVRNGRKHCAVLFPGREIIVITDDGIPGDLDEDERPGFAEMLNLLRERKVSAVVSRDQARIARDTDLWNKFRGIGAAAGIERLSTSHDGLIELGKGKAMTGMVKAVINQDYKDTISLNVRANQDSRAADGRPSNGRPYGYDNVVDPETRLKTIAINETQAAEIRSWAQRVLDGEHVASIVRDLNERGVLTKSGKSGNWTPTVVRQILTNPVITGLRRHRYQIVGEGTWDPILDRDTWLAVGAKLRTKKTITRKDGKSMTVGGKRRAGRKYVFTGLVWCAKCGWYLSGQWSHTDQCARYVCAPSKHGGCGKMSTKAENLELLVMPRIIEAFKMPEIRDLFNGDDPHAEQRAVLQRKRVAAESRRLAANQSWGAGEIDDETLASRLAGIGQALDKINADLAKLPARPDAKVDFDKLIAGWDQLDVATQREYLFDLDVRIDLAAAKPGKGTFDPSRVKLSIAGVKIPLD